MTSWLVGDFRLQRWLPLFKNKAIEQQYLSERFLDDRLSISRALIILSLFLSSFVLVDLQLEYTKSNYLYIALGQKLLLPVIGFLCFAYMNRGNNIDALNHTVAFYGAWFCINLYLAFYGYTHWVEQPVTLLEVAMASVFICLLIYIYAPLSFYQQIFGAGSILLTTLLFVIMEWQINQERVAFVLLFLGLANGFGISVSLTIHHNFRKYWANQIARDLDNQTLRQEITRREKLELDLKRLAMTDPLTGIDNRRSFMEQLQREIKRSTRQGSALSLINFDIDLFKHINDQFGHDTGDKVLISVSNLIKDRLRESDVLGRMGGEEFAILLPDCDNDEAIKLAEAFRIALSDHAIACHDKTLKITASFGVAQYEPTEDTGGLLKRADEAMYEAKKSGRNCVKSNQH